MTYAKIAALCAVIAAIFLMGYHVAATKGKADTEAVQLAWDKDKAAIQATADAAIAQATKDKETALANNEAISDDYQKQLDASRDMSRQLAQRLLKYASAAAASGGGVSKAGDRQGAAGAGTASGDASLTNALGAALAECSNNTAQLDALIVELKPQL